MATFEVIIYKQTSFQGRTEEWSNVYHLDTGIAEGFNDEAAIDSIVAIERAVHHNTVQYTRAQSYQINEITNNRNLRFEKLLAGPGGRTALHLLYVECAVLVQFELPRKTNLGFLGRKRRLSKWLHVCGVSGDSSSPYGVSPLSAAEQQFFVDTFATPLRTTSHGGGSLASPADGALPESVDVQNFVEHHQFHAGRRRSTNLI